MVQVFLRRGLVAVAALVGIVAVTRAVSVARHLSSPTDPYAVDATPVPKRAASAAPAAPVAAPLDTLPVEDSLLGRSRQLRFRTLDAAQAAALPGFIKHYGEEAIRTPAVHVVAQRGSAEPFAYIVMRPFGAKRGDYLDGYKLGRWPAERWMMAKNYLNPGGFIQVTPENKDLPLSPHFKLGDFVTHDQENVWPKYVVLQEALIDKLELVLQELEARRIPASHVVVLSGFRSPQYNERGAEEGMARASRHQYGDAADIIIDADGDGRMDDLNHDGRVDLGDTEVILRAIERIEFRYPEYRGGLGLYHAIGPRGPFAHIDVRGTVARWGR